MFDISILFPSPDYYAIQDALYIGWAGYDGNDPYDPNLIQQITDTYGIPTIGEHYFISDNNGGISPVWDFRSTLGSDAVVVATVTEDLPSPAGNPNVDWLSLDAVFGDLASNVLRLYSVGGDPPPAVSILRPVLLVGD